MIAAGTTVATRTSPKLPPPTLPPPHAPTSQPKPSPVMAASGANAAPYRHSPMSPASAAPTAAQVISLPQSSDGYTDLLSAYAVSSPNAANPTTARGRRATCWRGALSRNITNPSAPPPMTPHSSELMLNGCVTQPVMSSNKPMPNGRTGSSTIDRSEPLDSATK